MAKKNVKGVYLKEEFGFDPDFGNINKKSKGDKKNGKEKKNKKDGKDISQ